VWGKTASLLEVLTGETTHDGKIEQCHFGHRMSAHCPVDTGHRWLAVVEAFCLL
jgi:hypothetical protein